MAARAFTTLPYWGVQSPFDQLTHLQRQMDNLSDLLFKGSGRRSSVSAGVFPFINLTEDSDSYYLRAELPGISGDNLNIQVVGRNLTISGERSIPTEGKEARYHRKEREAGSFSRALSLPGDVDADKVAASMKNGILTITLPKSEASKPKQISVS
jgi:HSP20 family protein